MSEAQEQVRQTADAFVVELQHWRDVAGLARKRLSERMSYDPSYVGKVESGGARPTEDFARRADQPLHAGGPIVRRWKEYDLAARRALRKDHHVDEPVQVQSVPQPAGGLVVEHDHAELRYGDGKYHPVQRRKIRNVGAQPVTRYLIRISGDPERSNELYREHPLTWDELALFALAGDDERTWKVKHDRYAFKEVWLLFENRRAAAVVRTPEGEYITLLNPQIICESAETDEQYEGCRSFFDVRGKVPRPLSIEVEHQEVDGTRRITVFDRAIARLVAFEVDHLVGGL